MANIGHVKAKPPKISGEYPLKESPAGQVEEAALVDETMLPSVSVREAKDQLSRLLRRAARGEQIVITSDGQPKAMIVRYRPVIQGKPWTSHRALRQSLPSSPDSSVMIRKMRDGRP